MLLNMMLLKRLIIIRVKSKVDGIDTSAFVTRTKFTADTNALDDKIVLFYSFSHKKKIIQTIIQTSMFYKTRTCRRLTILSSCPTLKVT